MRCCIKDFFYLISCRLPIRKSLSISGAKAASQQWSLLVIILQRRLRKTPATWVSTQTGDLEFNAMQSWSWSEFLGGKKGPTWSQPCHQHRKWFKLQTNIPLQLKYKKDLNKMKGTSHFHSLTSEDNLTLKNARKINKIVSEVSFLFPVVA